MGHLGAWEELAARHITVVVLPDGLVNKRSLYDSTLTKFNSQLRMFGLLRAKKSLKCQRVTESPLALTRSVLAVTNADMDRLMRPSRGRRPNVRADGQVGT